MIAKVCGTVELMAMCRLAEKHEFNRQVATEILAENIDPQGIHLLEVIVPYHRASFGPSKEPIWPDHHRCQVYCKVVDSDEPVRFFLDIAVQNWEQFMSAEEFVRRMNDPIEAGIAAARAAAEEEEYA